MASMGFEVGAATKGLWGFHSKVAGLEIEAGAVLRSGAA
jgi:hypothetical protein